MAGQATSINLTDERATDRLGQDLALALQPGDCLALQGDLGAGKTSLARALIRCIAEDAGFEVPSPTFTIVQTYALRIPIAHFDLYRVADPGELDELGLDEALHASAVLVEWPERAAGQLPDNALTIQLDEEGDGRRATISGPAPVLDRFNRSFAIRGFLERSGCKDADRHFYEGDASTRAYERIDTGPGERRILMNAPQRLLGPVIRDGKRYAQIAHVAEDVRPFVAIAGLLRDRGFHTPHIFAGDLDAGFLLLEYLGDKGIIDRDGRPVIARWEAAVDCLVALHRVDFPRKIALADGPDHTIPRFDRDALLIEVGLLPQWYLPQRTGGEPAAGFLERFEQCWNALIDRLDDAEKSLVLRDFHSPNLLWQPGATGIDRIGIIDFQDAMIGPSAYDLASLVQDARVTVDAPLHARLVSRYLDARSGDPGFDPDGFGQALAIMQAQRASKLLGLFVRLKQRDGKPGYMRHLPRIETYLGATLQHPVLKPLQDCYTEAGIALSESG